MPMALPPPRSQPMEPADTPLFAFDLDGTLTRQELLPLIADRAGITVEMGALTAASVAGLVDPETSLRRRVSLLRDVAIENVAKTVAEVALFDRLRELVLELGSRAWVVTANLDVWVEPFVRSNFPDARLFCSQAATANGRVTAVSSYLNKASAVTAMRLEHPESRVVAVGEGANDVPMLKAADAAVVFFAVHTPARSAMECADYFVKTEARLCQLLRRL